mgnify:CR=1 FL=1
MNNENKKKKLKRIAKIFITLYLMSFFAVNWNDVSWIFNYKAVGGLIDDFFTPYQSTQAFSADSAFYPNHAANAGATPQVKFTYFEKNNILEIPKMGISVPIIFSQSANQTSLLKDLDKGVIYYPGSVFPGQDGQTVILGHSASPNWPKIKQDWVFSELDGLVTGDQIIVYIDYKKYTYTVRQKNILKRGQDIIPLSLAQGGNYLALVSCWPPGKDLQRIIVQATIDKD